MFDADTKMFFQRSSDYVGETLKRRDVDHGGYGTLNRANKRPAGLDRPPPIAGLDPRRGEGPAGPGVRPDRSRPGRGAGPSGSTSQPALRLPSERLPVAGM